MDTKLKNVTRKWYIKGIAYALLVGCVVFFTITIWKNIDKINIDTIAIEEYKDSGNVFNNISYFLSEVKDVEEYENGTTDNVEKRTESKLKEAYSEWANNRENYMISAEVDDYGDIYFNYEQIEEYYQGAVETNSNEEVNLTYEGFLNTFPDLEEKVKQAYSSEAERNYKESKEYVDTQTQFIYEIKEKESKEVLQLAENYDTYPIYFHISESGALDTNVGMRIANPNHYKYKQMGMEAYIVMTEEEHNVAAKKWLIEKEVTKDVVQTGIIVLCIGLLSFGFLLLQTGKRQGEEKIHLYPIDCIWSEIQYTVGLLSGIGFTLLCATVGYYDVKGLWLLQLIIAGMVVCGSVVLMLVLSQVRRLKAKKFLEGFICFRILRKIWRIIQSAWRRGKLSKRALAASILLPVLCATWVGAPFVIALLIYLIYKYLGDFSEITEGIKKIKEGQLNYKIQLKNKEGVLVELAENINSLSQGLEASVSNELRSERLKSELISNVSHDLKTPLTSIVTYVDLLKNEKVENANVKDYIEVLERKAQRLTVLTNDLFEAAKASSGDMPVNLEKVDLNAIVRQALGEFDEKLNLAELEVRTKLPEREAFIKADGRLTWRVIDNLLSNVVKYAQGGSRVYIEVEEEDGEEVLIMKNISAYELNIPSEELMERFKRGDESRNSEGSGLGLSIANSLVTLQHGSFRVEIDGDLFKVRMSLPFYRE